MEGMGMNRNFWYGKRVLLTGHTGFKGSWLALWLQKMGGVVTGYALPPASPESLFELAAVGEHMESVFADVRDLESLQGVVGRFRPEVVFHLAAQPLVRLSYLEPVQTFHVNVMGTVNLLEAVRRSQSCRAVVCITSDKCYENKEWVWGYRESDPLGGHDPYSASKACAEVVSQAYRRSFFATSDSGPTGVATARAGNVIGGGDFSKDRLVPDIMTAITKGRPLNIRSPGAIRPWQHVLEPLSGYLLLAEKLWSDPKEYAQSWNFGPVSDDARSVRWMVEKLNDCWGEGISWKVDDQPTFHEANVLTLDSTKAHMQLGWQPRWTLDQALAAVVDWYKVYQRGEPLHELVLKQIASYATLAV
jgi:CDP-glucose 4,6-dehydratase